MTDTNANFDLVLQLLNTSEIKDVWGLPYSGIVCGMLEYLDLNIWSVLCRFLHSFVSELWTVESFQSVRLSS